MQQHNSTKTFLIHITKYLGIGLISGSIVHAGTLGGDYVKYIILIITGILLFVIGNVLEHGMQSIQQMIPYIGISTVLSIGTGMVSGGTQHYLDGPMIAAVLLPLGFFLAYLALIYRDFKHELTIHRAVIVFALSVLLYGGLYGIGKILTKGQVISVLDTTTPIQSDGHRHVH